MPVVIYLESEKKWECL